MIHLLVIYERRTGKLLREEEFTDSLVALRARFDAERGEYRDRPDVEIVVLGAQSREDLLRTHGRYFRG